MSCDPVTGICVPPPTVSCIPPLLWHTTRCECGDGSMPIGFADGRAICASPPPPPVIPQCSVTISYAANDPNVPQIVKPSDMACDAIGLQLAILAALAHLVTER